VYIYRWRGSYPVKAYWSGWQSEGPAREKSKENLVFCEGRWVGGLRGDVHGPHIRLKYYPLQSVRKTRTDGWFLKKSPSFLPLFSRGLLLRQPPPSQPLTSENWSVHPLSLFRKPTYIRTLSPPYFFLWYTPFLLFHYSSIFHEFHQKFAFMVQLIITIVFSLIYIRPSQSF
jgi:hypothetical protein